MCVRLIWALTSPSLSFYCSSGRNCAFQVWSVKLNYLWWSSPNITCIFYPKPSSSCFSPCLRVKINRVTWMSRKWSWFMFGWFHSAGLGLSNETRNAGMLNVVIGKSKLIFCPVCSPVAFPETWTKSIRSNTETEFHVRFGRIYWKHDWRCYYQPLFFLSQVQIMLYALLSTSCPAAYRPVSECLKKQIHVNLTMQTSVQVSHVSCGLEMHINPALTIHLFKTLNRLICCTKSHSTLRFKIYFTHPHREIEL